LVIDTHGFTHATVKGACAAIKAVVTFPKIDHSGFHPDTFICQDIETLHALFRASFYFLK
jgi:hypothetical protein